ncbi:hypothetical protein [Bartonella doshiae]|nr:hypothetical protein [Bartonella doshiae]
MEDKTMKVQAAGGEAMEVETTGGKVRGVEARERNKECNKSVTRLWL